MLKRIITAVALITLISVTLLWAPIWVFNLFVIMLMFGGLVEFFRMVLPNDIFSLITGLIFCTTLGTISTFVGMTDSFFAITVVMFFCLILVHMFYFTTVEGVANRIGLILFATLYIALTMPVFAWLRRVPHGRSLIVLTIAIVAIGDTFAYSFGKLIGKHKLSPLISPNKTIEGLIASFFGGAFAALICWRIFWPELHYLFIIILGIFIAMIGALGDLIESLIKRSCHTKDSGNILPGHGGILDRIDALLFATPFVYFIFSIVGYI